MQVEGASPRTDPTDRHGWAQVPAPVDASGASGPSLISSIAALTVVAVVAGWLLSWKLGLVLGALFVLLLLLERRGPKRARALGRKVRGAQHSVGQWMQRAALGVAWLAVVLPTSFLRSDRIRVPAGWVDRDETRVNSPARQFAVVEPRPAGRSRSAKLLVAIGAVVSLIALDLAIGSAIDALQATGSQADQRPDVAAYEDSPWAREYWNNHHQADNWEYLPFVGWRRADIESEHINIDDGLRTTWSGSGSSDAVEVWMFGGSTTWGAGQRDDHTIPSSLARLGDAAGIPVHVTNYGEGAYLLWQEVQLLQSELLSGGAPDLVLFYDGANEPAQHGFSVVSGPTHARVRVFARQLEGRERNGVSQEILDRSLTIKVARRVRGLVGSQSSSTIDERSVVPAVALANIMRVYEEGVHVTRDVGERYDFETFHFWQPTLYSVREVAPEDEVWSINAFARWDHDWYREIYEGAQQRLPAGVIDISDALDDAPSPVWVDPYHTNELGASIVADRIFAEIESTLRQIHEDKQADE